MARDSLVVKLPMRYADEDMRILRQDLVHGPTADEQQPVGPRHAQAVKQLIAVINIAADGD